MQFDSAQWQELIFTGAATLGLSVSPAQVQAFSLHAQELIRWNRRINLTTIVEPQAVAIKHILDAIAPLAHIPDQGELLDVGTGGGFPGIPLKIMRPGQPMTLIDGSRKKISFIKHLIRLLGLDGIQTHHARAEALGQKNEYRERFHAIVSRAVADPSALVRMAAGLLAPGGKMIVYQGPHGRSSVGNGGGKTRHLPGEVIEVEYQLPFSNDPRKLIILDMPLDCV